MSEFFVSLEDLDGLNADGTIVDGEQLAASLPEDLVDIEQIDALRDGQVSLEEFTELVRLEVECLRAVGLDVTDVQITRGDFDLDTPTYGFRDPVSEGSSAGFEQQSVCQRQYSFTYQQIYKAERLPTIQEQEALLVAEAQSYISCAEEYNEEPPFESLTEEALPLFISWYSEVGPVLSECVFAP